MILIIKIWLSSSQGRLVVYAEISIDIDIDILLALAIEVAPTP